MGIILKMSDSDNDQGPPEEQKDEKQIAKEIEEKTWEAFMAFDKEGTGVISSGEVKFVLEMIGVKFTESEMFKMISEIDPENSGNILYSDFKPVIIEKEMARIRGSDEEELLDAFVAMGGESNGEGCVDAKKLISTIKEEFQMTIDIEKLIEEIDEDGSGEIEFDELQALLQTD